MVAIASHIALDGMTSFGTRLWDPISQRRIAWDMLFIIDFTFTSIALLPQVAAWVYRDAEKWRGRAIRMWALFTFGALAVWEIARSVEYPFHLWIVALASLIFIALFFLPARGDFGLRFTRARWCQAGTYVLIAYTFFCGVAHHAALKRVQSFAAENHVAVERIAAIPLPPSLLSWGGLVRSTDGVYQTRIDLRDPAPPDFHFVADSPPDEFTARALRLPEVQLYLQFARFPVIRTEIEDGHHAVEFGEHRFVNPRRGQPQPFTYRVVFDSAGNVIEEGWLSNGFLLRRMKKISPAPRTGGSQ
jgi:LexA-binding, inner membrane-associated putative hydrolase